MTHCIQKTTAKHAQLTKPMQQEVFDFIEFMLARHYRPNMNLPC